jgi:hypothetical protein
LDFLDSISAQLDLMDPTALEGIEGGAGTNSEGQAPEGITNITDATVLIKCHTQDKLMLSLRYQLEELTASLLEKALRGTYLYQ